MPDEGARGLMAFDFGTRKIGVAVGQALTGTASGIASVQAEPEDIRWQRIDELIREWRPHALVVGLPLDARGAETPGSQAARGFGKDLGEKFGLPIYWVNEYLTSQAAQAQLIETVSPGKRFSKRKQKSRDLLAAELILRSHFES
jgi:putative holliday junction resolvase